MLWPAKVWQNFSSEAKPSKPWYSHVTGREISYGVGPVQLNFLHLSHSDATQTLSVSWRGSQAGGGGGGGGGGEGGGGEGGGGGEEEPFSRDALERVSFRGSRRSRLRPVEFPCKVSQKCGVALCDMHI